MAFARKCDRCNNLYEPAPVKIRKKDVNAIMLIDKDFKEEYWTRHTLDLCPQCLKNLKEFLNVFREEEEA